VIVPVASTAALLAANHYLGPTKTALFAWQDEFGCMVFGPPRSRRLPQKTWLELSRWCIVGPKNSGSQQWARFIRWAIPNLPEITTFLSYSDPSVGHKGALYKACNWSRAPTWHRLRPPPTGNGCWVAGKVQSVKDRWVYPIRADAGRAALLAIHDKGLAVKFAHLAYQEPQRRWAA